jgi:hypothetical protein
VKQLFSSLIPFFTNACTPFNIVAAPMKNRSSLLVLTWLCGWLVFGGGFAHATDIRPAPGGPRILFVDGDDIRPAPGGKRLLFVDGTDIRPAPGGPRLLCLEQDNVRPTPNGIRLAFWDGKELRRTPGGKVLLYIDGDDIRDKFGGTRLYFLDGPKLSQAQLTAVLYLLKPELFKLSSEETAAKEKEMANNAAAEEKRTGADPWLGDHAILTTAATSKRTGSIVIAKQAEYYAITYKTGENPAWQGIGMVANMPGGQELWAAVAPAGATAFGVYDISGPAVRAFWVPVNAKEDKSVLGFENLSGGGRQFGGMYRILSGKLPNGGAAYTGTLNVERLPATLNGTAPCYRIRWTNGASAVGFAVQTRFLAAAGWGADWEVLRIRSGSSSLTVDFLNKDGGEGSYTLGK